MNWKRGGQVDRQARWGGREADEERVPTEAGVPLPAVGIEDPEGRPPAGRAGAVAGDHDLRGLADHVPPKADPGLPGELQADPRPLPDRGGHGCHEPGRLQDEEGDPCPPGQGRKPAKAVREPGRPFRPGRQVHDEEVHGPAGEERARDREPLLRAGRGEDDEPLGLDAAGHGLHRVECRREVQPGDDGATGLRLRGEPEGERGPPAREVPSEREAHPSGKPARPEDGVQLREPGREDAGRVRRRRQPPPEVAARSARTEATPPRAIRPGMPVPARGRPSPPRRGAARPHPSAIEGSQEPPSRPGRGLPSGVSIEHLFE